jgi:phosphate transport system protein
MEALASSVAAMGDSAASQFSDAVIALLTQDQPRAQSVIDRDGELDALRRDISTATAAVITKRQPVASDLNEVLADFHIAEDLERVGDLAKNTAKRALTIGRREFPENIIISLRQLGESALNQLRAALAAYTSRNPEAALAARDQDEDLDRLHTRVFREIVARTRGDQQKVVGFVHLLFCAKNIERVGDHAAHIAEDAYQLSTGHPPPTERRRLDESSSITGDTFVSALRLLD